MGQWEADLSAASLAFHARAEALARADAVVLDNGLAISQLADALGEASAMQEDVSALLDGVEQQQTAIEGVLDGYVAQVRDFREREDVKLRCAFFLVAASFVLFLFLKNFSSHCSPRQKKQRRGKQECARG
jgi:hypothetical protein